MVAAVWVTPDVGRSNETPLMPQDTKANYRVPAAGGHQRQSTAIARIGDAWRRHLGQDHPSCRQPGPKQAWPRSMGPCLVRKHKEASGGGHRHMHALYNSNKALLN